MSAPFGGRGEPSAKALAVRGRQATREMTNTKSIERGGSPALEGKCVVCGSTIFVLGAT
jgi:hypothetical protein